MCELLLGSRTGVPPTQSPYYKERVLVIFFRIEEQTVFRGYVSFSLRAWVSKCFLHCCLHSSCRTHPVLTWSPLLCLSLLAFQPELAQKTPAVWTDLGWVWGLGALCSLLRASSWPSLQAPGTLHFLFTFSELLECSAVQLWSSATSCTVVSSFRSLFTPQCVCIWRPKWKKTSVKCKPRFLSVLFYTVRWPTKT